jgi:hypothetical protein
MLRFLSKEDYTEIRSFVYRNARPLEFALWQYHFEDGSKNPVLYALMQYQNADGGFGNAIEPDNWNPESTPYSANYVIEILREMDFMEIEHPIYQGIFRYLENTAYQGDNGWFFSVPENDFYPHAIWWQYNHEGNEKNQNIGITASLSGFILRYLNSVTELYDTAMKYADMLLNRLKSDDSFGDMGILGYCDLYKDLQAAGLQSRFDLDFLECKTRELIKKHFHEYRWNYHQDMAGVLPNPSVYYYSGYEQAVSDALDELIEIRHEKGVWNIPWQWYDDGKYTKEFAISENWWKSTKAIEKLLFLKAYGRLSAE